MQGVGNDFVVVDAAALPDEILKNEVSLPRLAIQTCDRKFGIGADGLLVVSREIGSGAAFRMRMFNPDGTEDMCGNGLRCVSLWAHSAGWLDGRTQFVVAVKDGVRDVQKLSVAADGRTASFGVDMGVPQLAPSALPFCDSGRTRIVGYPLTVGGETVLITAVNTGSTHTVLFGPQPDEETFQRISPRLETHPCFPERTSVLWATVRNQTTIDIRIWERGAGETLGCGTGACAVGVAAIVNGLCAPNIPIQVISKGGTLTITWPGEGAPVHMAGPAQIVYIGEFALNAPR